MLKKGFVFSAKFVLCSLLAVTFFLPRTTSTAHAVVSTAPYGVTVLAKKWNLDPSYDTGADLHNLGVQWVRIQFSEHDIAETDGNPETWDWTNACNGSCNLDQILKDAANHHLLIDIPLQGFDSDDVDATCGLPKGDTMGNYGKALVQHFQSLGVTISAIEMGNEEFSPGRFNWTGSCGDPKNAAAIYAQVVQTANPTIKAVFNGKIGMYGITSIVGQLTNLQIYLGYLYSDGMASYIDYYNFHYYNNGLPPSTGSNPTLPDVINAFYTAEKSQKKEIWMTEFGWQTNVPGGGCDHVVSQQTQADYITGSKDGTIQGAEQIMQGDENQYDTTHAFLYTIETGNDCHSIDPGTGPYSRNIAYGQLQSYIQNNPTWG